MSNVHDVTLSCDTGALGAGEIIADLQEVPGFFRKPNEVAELISIIVLDEDDRGEAIDLIFARAAVSLGTGNAAPTISDANSRDIIGRVSVLAADFTDLGGMKEATKTAIALLMKASASSSSLWVGAITRSGTPTYTAAGLKLRLGVVS